MHVTRKLIRSQIVIHSSDCTRDNGCGPGRPLQAHDPRPADRVRATSLEFVRPTRANPSACRVPRGGLVGAARDGRLALSEFWEPEGESYLSLENLLAAVHERGDETAEVWCHLRSLKLGSWRRLHRLYGDSVVTWEDGNDILLRQWCADAADADGDEGWLRVKLLKVAEPLSERAFIVRHQAEDGLRRLDDGQLMQVWFDRKKLDPSIRGMMIRKIWDELEIRHEGLTRRAINIKVPFVHGLDTTRMKQHIFQVLDEVGAEWPVWLVLNLGGSQRVKKATF